ncbi:MAG: hypothetical protein AABZ08_02070 [Planctomycetota bacterium]
MILRNRTHLDTSVLQAMCLEAVAGWPTDGLNVWVRYSRGADFSGVCYYKTGRVFINLGRHLKYPYQLRTHLARARSGRNCWWREMYTLEIGDAYQLVLFIYLHEFYHWLVRRARRNTRQKEGMCDRFAARVIVDRWGGVVRDGEGRVIGREEWDFQDLEGFVWAARQRAVAV